MLILSLKFGLSKIIWGLRVRGSKCESGNWGLKFRVGGIIWGLIFPCTQKLIFSLKFFRWPKRAADLGSLRKLAWEFLAIEKNTWHEHPCPKSQGVPLSLGGIVTPAICCNCNAVIIKTKWLCNAWLSRACLTGNLFELSKIVALSLQEDIAGETEPGRASE